MGSWSSFLFAYFLGGVTFIPLVVLVVLFHAHYTFPTRHDVNSSSEDEDNIIQPGDDLAALDDAKKDDAKTKPNPHLDVASGYFAVCREYTPMGINAKPIERSTPLGSATVAAPSPSVYQTMYRSIFERKGVNTAGGAAGQGEKNSMSQRPKNAGNVFYLVLRHGHLMLFDDEEQLEVRHVISLAHHDISIYSGGDVTPEGELFIKRNALRLSRKQDSPELGPDSQVSKPFYLFSENCSAKEDFYFALLKNKGQTFGASKDKAPSPKSFDVKHIISLVQKLHSSEDNLHSRWVNAMIGRVFLGVYKTADLEYFIREKITKKIARVKRPAFLTGINIRRIDTGEAAPYFTNLKLRDLTVEGDCVVEADVKYSGNFRIEVAATAKIDLGPRFKAREVNLVLAVVAKRVEGHALLKIKPPPSNRAWITFQTMPKMELTIEPIVSARQITYTVILRQIENRIKEVVAETLVLPFWDDIPFFKTEHKAWRGGIFEGDDAVDTESKDAEDALAQSGDVDTVDRIEEKPELLAETRPMEKSISLPVIEKEATAPGLFGRKMKTANGPSPAGSSTSIDTKSSFQAGGPKSPQILSNPEPVATVGTDSAHADIFKPSTSPPDTASTYMAALHTRSQHGSPEVAPHDSPGQTPSISSALTENYPALSLNSNKEDGEKTKEAEDEGEEEATPIVPAGRRNTTSSGEAAPTSDVPDSPVSTKSKYATASLGRNFWLRRENSTASTATSSTSGDASSSTQKTNNTLAAVSNAAAQARQWGWNAIQRQKDAKKSSSEASSSQVDLSQPMGRGQPLPPPGTPLPMPSNGKTKIGPIGPIPVPKRKPLPQSSTPPGDSEEEQPPPVPHRRKRGASYDDQDEGEQGMLVIAAPIDSQPGTPAAEIHADFAASWDESTDAATLEDDQSSRLISQTTQASTPPPEVERGSTTPVPAVEKIEEEKVPVETPDIPAQLVEKSVEKPVEKPMEKPVEQPAKATTAEDDDDYSGWMDDSDVQDVPEAQVENKHTDLATPVIQEGK